MNEQPRYSTLQDYVRVVRRHRLVISALTLGAAVVVLALSLAETKTYEATASVSFRDPLADLDLFSGDDSPPEFAPFQLATINAELIDRREVTRRVQDALDTELSADELAAAITTQVNVQTNLVSLTGSVSDPDFAADLANKYADVAKKIGTRDARKRSQEAERLLEDQLADARKDLPQSTFQVSVITSQLQRVRLLRTAEPVKIEGRAEVPDTPVSPKPVRNTILGGLVGLLAGFLLAFVRDALDRRVRSAADVNQELGLPVLGRIDETAFGYQGLVKQAALKLRPRDFESFRVLRSNLAYLKPGGPRTVLVTSATPEEGKTTVSIALASAAAVAGQKVLLVETDLRKPSFTTRIGVPASPGLTDFLEGEARPNQILNVLELIEPPTLNGLPAKKRKQHQFSLVCIGAGSPTATAAELLGGARFKDFVDKVSRAYDLVILDTSPLLAVADPIELAALVESVLVCVRSDRATRDQLRATREILSHLPEQRTAAVLTGIKRGDPDGYSSYYGY